MLRVVQRWTADPAKDGQEAVAYAKTAVDLDPSSPLALTMLGCAYRSVDRDLDRAQVYLNGAVELNPNEPLACLFKATIHGLQGERDEAIRAADRALATSPLDPMRAYYESLAASTAENVGDFDRAIVLARSALSANMMHASTYRALAIALMMVGHKEDACQVISRLLSIHPDATIQEFLDRRDERSPYNDLFAKALIDAGMPRATYTDARRNPSANAPQLGVRP
jgi:tetratricopeptide (TPR) repeat protein